MKKALVVGIDDYPNNPLNGCVNDAAAIANLLETNGDGAPNFSVVLKTGSGNEVSTVGLNDSIAELFTGDADTALFFFAGHGVLTPDASAGYIVSQNGQRGSWGVPLSYILTQANKAYPRISSTVIILDCCHSGAMGEVATLGNDAISVIGNGVTILTACHRSGTADEINGHGLFTALLLDAIAGSSADICGRITPASVYAHIDQALGPWEQRPIYKANVQTFITLRQIAPKIPLEVLRRLPEYFPTAAYEFPLDPSFEPDRNNVSAEYRNTPVNKDNANIFRELQMCNRHGLVSPISEEHMFFAAIHSTGCRLTALGTHYRKLAEMKRI